MFRTAVLVLLLFASRLQAESDIEYKQLPKSNELVPAAAIVGPVTLLHTGQILPFGKDGKVVAEDAQIEQAFDNLKTVLEAGGADTNRIARLNVHLREHKLIRPLSDWLAKKKRAGDDFSRFPPMTLLIKNLPHPDAVIALDAVAVGRETKAVEFVRPDKVQSLWGSAAAALLPVGPRVYVAGQAEKGATPAEATRKTLESLRATLKSFGLNDSHVVQCKAFLTPITAVDEVAKEFAAHFGKDKVPPLVFVEWKSSLPIEIELIAHAPAPKRKAWDEIDYLTPPGMTVSPIYSRVARVHSEKTIYTGSLFPRKEGDGKSQVEDVFAQLGTILEECGSDFRHLAKATYYVSNDDCSTQLNKLRPNYYDPRRPPSASKAMVAYVGADKRSIAIDMIAVPSTIKKEGKPELGHGLSDERAREGWLSLFDGATTFGWKGAKVQEGTLVAGRTTVSFPAGRVIAEVEEGGTLTVAGKDYEVGPGRFFDLKDSGGKGPVILGEGVRLKRLAMRFHEMKSIMPGDNLSGWKRIDRPAIPEEKRPKWVMKDGVLEAVGGPGALEYPTLYGNAIIQVEVRSRNRHANGGLFFRSIPGDFMNGYEAQIHSACEKGDPAKPAEYATGGLDDRQNARRLVSRDFEPFVLTVIADGPHIATWVNGYQVTDWTDMRKEHKNPRQGLRMEPGTIQLQAHDPATDLEFRAIRVVEFK